MFCMFGERIGLLPSKLFGRLLETAKANPAMLTRRLQNLFRAMADGGDFGAETIPRFNGGLFAEDDAVPLTEPEINILASLGESIRTSRRRRTRRSANASRRTRGLDSSEAARAVGSTLTSQRRCAFLPALEIQTGGPTATWCAPS